MGRSVISTAQTIAVNECLKQVITRLEDGSCEYHDEWTDRRVAREMDVSLSSVTKIRREQYGPLTEKASQNVTLSPAEVAMSRALGMHPVEYARNKILLAAEGMRPTPGEVARLKKVEELEQKIEELQGRIDRLEEIILLQGKLT